MRHAGEKEEEEEEGRLLGEASGASRHNQFTWTYEKYMRATTKEAGS